MAKTWWCPAHQGSIAHYVLLSKTVGKGRWKLQIRCLTPVAGSAATPEGPKPATLCRAVLNVMKGGVYLDQPAPSKAAA